MKKLRDLLLTSPQVESLNADVILFTLAVAAFCGLVIWLVYRFFNKSVVYSASFNMLNMMICVVTAFIITTIGANLVLSLGMVGALSIVRFRAAVKDPLDVGFLFWGVAAGLTAGARLYPVALLGTAFIAVVYIAFSFMRLDRQVFLLIIRYREGTEFSLADLKPKLKNKTFSNGMVELTVEVKIRRGDTSFVNPLQEIPGVSSVTLVEYSGDFA